MRVKIRDILNPVERAIIFVEEAQCPFNCDGKVVWPTTIGPEPCPHCTARDELLRDLKEVADGGES